MARHKVSNYSAHSHKAQGNTFSNTITITAQFNISFRRRVISGGAQTWSRIMSHPLFIKYFSLFFLSTVSVNIEGVTSRRSMSNKQI